VARRWWLLAAAMACALGGCGVAGSGGVAMPRPATAGNTGTTDGARPALPGLVDPRPLHGAGAVAFDPTRPQLAWAAGHEVRRYALDDGSERPRMAIGSQVADLGYAPDGALWVVANEPQLWRDGALLCRASGVDGDRLLAVDAEGAVVTTYSHSDGVGMLRRQVWLDPQCGVVEDELEPVPAGVTSPDADPGAPLRRESLQVLRPGPADLEARLSQVQLPAGAGVKNAVRVSPDGRWWILEGVQGRTLWRLDRP
jgi:hypothetical protein